MGPGVECAQYEDLLGVPFRHAGRDPQTGLDCFGVIVELARRRGLALPDPFAAVLQDWALRETAWSPEAWIAETLGGWRKLPGPEAGSVVAISRGGHVVDHAGVVVDARHFLHALEGAGVVLGRLDRAPWRDLIVGYYTYAQV